MARRMCIKCNSTSPMDAIRCEVCGESFVKHWQDTNKDAPGVVEAITKARGETYGPFICNAIVGQALRSVIRNLPDPDNNRRWEDLPLDVREGLDYIVGKISRIVTGDPEHLDNWDDIGGFAKIVADRIRRKQGI